ncbi:hydrophobin-domain-containing protein [Punctularia strigosozonata HHB-11173 SS5]|uniref:hydrophobin-domain-containing protein n=1 Tax=Punctularia strigosozonata (strain HHB-11173) TaxID=741275 RepID=UPI00044181EF|nr:hydrophobin-domain-containing protein [Punctularia strigosozonata HHB-11173 SS5]EIN09122.1 hydrophobin-domain-containing protein [Punctularia strigosozonata HHB-11173 SS5]
MFFQTALFATLSLALCAVAVPCKPSDVVSSVTAAAAAAPTTTHTRKHHWTTSASSAWSVHTSQTTSSWTSTAVPSTATAAGSSATGAGQCNTGPVQCCNSVQSSKEDAVSNVLGALGIPIQDTAVPVGLACTPINVIGLGSGASCTQQPVCCENNDYNGAVALGCSPINL